MNFQGTGLTLDAKTGDRYFIAGGIHAGAVIVNATHADKSDKENRGLFTGRYYKDSGVFIAPYIQAGISWAAVDLMVSVKHVEVTLGEKSDKISVFSGTYAGIGWAVRF